MSSRDRDRHNIVTSAAGRGVTGQGRPGRGSASTGLVSLGAKRGRSVGAPPAVAGKLAVPKPVNLPSLRKENAGNDPSTQIVPTGSSGGWTKPDSPAPASVPDTREAPAAAAASWGSAAARSAAAPWQPPDASLSPPPTVAASVGYKGVGPVVDRRRLNPSEYPSLDATVSAKTALATQLARSSALISGPVSKLVGDRDWDDDDRVADAGNSALLLQSRLVGGDGRIESELLPGWEPEVQRTDGERLVPVLGLSSPAREPLRAPPPAELPPIVLSTTHRTAPDAATVPEKVEPRPLPPVRGELLREGSSGRWRDSPEWRQQPADATGHDRPDRNGFDRAADWDRRGDRPIGRDHGRHAQHGSRSALAGPLYNDLRMELVDPTLFPPLPPGRSPRHGPQQLSDDSSAERAVDEAEPLADDRDEFEKELDAVVAELQRERSRKLEQLSAPPAESEPVSEPAPAVSGPPSTFAPAVDGADAAGVPSQAAQAGPEGPRRPAKLPPPPRAELLKQQQEEEERRKAAAAAKLADIERRIALRQEAEAKAAAEAALAAAAAQELAAATTAEDYIAAGPAVTEPAEPATLALDDEQPAKVATPSPEQAPPPNAWVKPLTLANGVLDTEHTALTATAANAAAAAAEDPAVSQELELSTATQRAEPAIVLNAPEPLRASDETVAAAGGTAAELADAPRGQRPQRGRGRARAERLYDPEQADRQGPRSGRGSRGSRRLKDGAPQPPEDDAAVAPDAVEGTEGRGRRSRHHRDASSGSGRPSGSRGRGSQAVAAARGAQAGSDVPVVAAPTSTASRAAEPVLQTASDPAPVVRLDWDAVIPGAPPSTEATAAELSRLHIAAQAPAPKPLTASVSTVAPVAPRDVMSVPLLEEPSPAVSWPRSAAAQDDHLQAGVLANGIPALPADLSLDTPALGPKLPASQPQRQPSLNAAVPPPPPGLGFGVSQQQRGQGQVTGFPAPSFGGLIWSQAPGTGGNLWQPPPPPPPQQQQQTAHQPAFVPQLPPAPAPQRNLPSHSQLEAFYGANQQPAQAFTTGAGAAFSSGPQQAVQGSLGPQFGNFGAAFHQPQPGGQFSHFGAFVPTGKQPDWSVPPNPLQTQPSGMGSHTAGQGFPLSSRASTGLDSIWQSPDASARFLPPVSSPGLNGPMGAGASRPPQHLGQAIDVGFLPNLGPTAPHVGVSSGGLMQPQGVMAPGLPDTLLGEDINSAAMRQRLPNGNVRREGSMRGQRGRGGMQPQSMPHRGRGAPRGAVRASGRMPATVGRADGRHDAVLTMNSGGTHNSIENDSMGSMNSRARSGRGGRGGRSAGPPPKPAAAMKAQSTG